MHLFSKSDVYVYVFMFKLRSILEVDLLNLCIYVQTQKYTGNGLFKLMYFFSNFLLDFLDLYIYVQTLKHI